MKSMKITLLAVVTLLMGYGSVVAGDGDPKINVRQNQEERKAVIRVMTLSEDNTAVLKIKDQDGRVMHRELLRGNTVYAKRYDLSGLPDGAYVVEVTSNQGVSQEALNLKAGSSEVAYFKPAVQVESEMIKVMFKNSIASSVALKLYDEQGRVLFQENVSSQGQFAKGLDVSRLASGQYSLSIVGNNYTYSKSIALK